MSAWLIILSSSYRKSLMVILTRWWRQLRLSSRERVMPFQTLTLHGQQYWRITLLLLFLDFVCLCKLKYLLRLFVRIYYPSANIKLLASHPLSKLSKIPVHQRTTLWHKLGQQIQPEQKPICHLQGLPGTRRKQSLASQNAKRNCFFLGAVGNEQ